MVYQNETISERSEEKPLPDPEPWQESKKPIKPKGKPWVTKVKDTFLEEKSSRVLLLKNKTVACVNKDSEKSGIAMVMWALNPDAEW